MNKLTVIEVLKLSPTEYYKYTAERAAINDKAKGLKADPSRHDALDHSAWAEHYNETFYKA